MCQPAMLCLLCAVLADKLCGSRAELYNAHVVVSILLGACAIACSPSLHSSMSIIAVLFWNADQDCISNGHFAKLSSA